MLDDDEVFEMMRQGPPSYADAAESTGADVGVRISPFREQDVSALWALSQRVRPQHHVSPARWRWQYEQNPHATHPGIALAWSGDRLVGQMATMPVRAVCGGNELDARWQLDTMVDPAFRRQGIGTLLLRYQATQHPFSMALGTSDSMFALRMKEGWIRAQPTDVYIRPLRPADVFKSRVKAEWASRALGYVYDRFYRLPQAVHPRVSSVGRFDAAVTDLWERRASQLMFAVRRDARFLNWRYGNVPGREYHKLAFRGDTGRLRGYCVLSRLSKPQVFGIADLLTDQHDDEAMVALTTAALLLARDAGASRVLTLVTNDEVKHGLKSCGFVKSRYPSRLTCAPIPQMESALKDSANWYVTMGDSDEELTL